MYSTFFQFQAECMRHVGYLVAVLGQSKTCSYDALYPTPQFLYSTQNDPQMFDDIGEYKWDRCYVLSTDV